MRIIYYSREYYCHHGARTHAREFFSALKKQHSVSHVEVYPPVKANREVVASDDTTSQKLRRLIPDPVRRSIRLIVPSRNNIKCFKEAVVKNNIDIAIMRISGSNLRIISQIKKELPELIVCIEMNSSPYAEALPGNKVWFRRFWENIEAKGIGRADCVTVVSSWLKKYLIEKGVAKHKIYFNPNGVNPGLFCRDKNVNITKLRREFGVPDNAFVLGYAGGMEFWRRLPRLIEMIAELRRNNIKDIFLLMVGDGTDMPAVQAVIRENVESLNGYVWCKGRRPYEEIPRIMQLFDVAVFPFSNPYGSPQKLFEYLAMGIPTIGPDVPAVREVFINNKHLVLAKQDGSNFKEAIMTLKNSPDLARKLAEEGRKYVLDHYTWHQNAERVLSAIRTSDKQ